MKWSHHVSPLSPKEEIHSCQPWPGACQASRSKRAMSAERGHSVSGSLVRACRDLLRHADHPDRLKSNILLKRLSACNLLPSSFAARLNLVIREALECVTPRQRCIVKRCDLGRERIRDVACDLGISERHAFRERNKAHRQIAEYISGAELESPSYSMLASDQTELLLALARSLEQCGQTERALVVLRNSLHYLSDALTQCRIELRLSELNISIGLLKSARCNLERARLLSSEFHPDSWLYGHIDLAEAKLAWEEDNVDLAERLLQKALVHLRRSTIAADDYSALDALGLALVTHAMLAFDRGHLAGAARAVSEGLAVMDRNPNPNATISLDLRVWSALIRMAADADHEYAAKCLSDCYNQAVSQNLVREAIGISAKIGSLLSQLRQFDRAHEVLTATLLVARGNCAPDALVETLVAHARVDNLRKRPQDALAKLAEARRCDQRFDVPTYRSKNFMDLTEAGAYLSLKNYSRALERARAVECHYREAGLVRLSAASLEVCAFALAGLNEFTNAREVARESAEAFERIGMPARATPARALLLNLGMNRTHT